MNDKTETQQQEPVAWVNQANLNSAAIQRNRGGQGDTHTWSETPNAYHPIPLYTTPPQRKPLTDEQTMAAYKLACSYGVYESNAFALTENMFSIFKENT